MDNALTYCTAAPPVDLAAIRRAMIRPVTPYDAITWLAMSRQTADALAWGNPKWARLDPSPWGLPVSVARWIPYGKVVAMDRDNQVVCVFSLPSRDWPADIVAGPED